MGCFLLLFTSLARCQFAQNAVHHSLLLTLLPAGSRDQAKKSLVGGETSDAQDQGSLSIFVCAKSYLCLSILTLRAIATGGHIDCAHKPLRKNITTTIRQF